MNDRRDDVDAAQLLTALTTEHFTLQGARSQTMSESSARASVYVFSVSSALVALGFVAQISEVGDIFRVFALTVLPTLYLLGSVTYIRMVECGADDIVVINGVVGGTAIAVALGALVDASLGLATVVGAAAAIASILAWIRYADRLLDANAAEIQPLFPSPAPEPGRRQRR